LDRKRLDIGFERKGITIRRPYHTFKTVGKYFSITSSIGPWGLLAEGTVEKSTDLMLSDEIAIEWEDYIIVLQEAGVSLSDHRDSLMWIGGDASGRINVKNLYDTVSSTQDHQSAQGWKANLWKWKVRIKINLFLWLAASNKILT
jgi:hypothetical protein